MYRNQSFRLVMVNGTLIEEAWERGEREVRMLNGTLRLIRPRN